MDVKNGSFRLCADPSIGVADLMAAVEDFLSLAHKQRSINLLEFVKVPPGVSWKTTPTAGHLATVSPLLCCYLRRAKNGVLPAAKHKSALAKLDESLNLNAGKGKNREDWVDQVDDNIRMTLSHLRGLKASEVSKQRLFRKADVHQQQQIEELLSFLQMPEEFFVTPRGEASSPSSNSGALALMDAEPQALVVGDKLEEAAAGSPVGLQDIDPAAVFASVLSQEPIAAASPMKNTKPAKAPASSGSAAEEKPGQGFLATLMACGVLTADEVAMVKGSTLEDGPVKPKPKPKAKAKVAKPKPSASKVAKKGNARAKPATAQQAEEEPAGEDEDAAELPVVRTPQKKPAKKIP